MRILTVLVMFITISGCASLERSNSENVAKVKLSANVLVVKHVNIIPMTLENRVIKNASIVVKDNKILSINGEIPNNAIVINGKGKWLIPGLIDMHVHGLSGGSFSTGYPTRGDTIFFDTQDVMTPYLASGVTTVFELSARKGHFRQRNEIEKGAVIGPRMALAAVIDGKGERIAMAPSVGRQIVRNLKKQGYRFIKVYTWLNKETFKAIIEEAKKQEIKVVGHIPVSLKENIESVFIASFLIAHAEELSKLTSDYSYSKAQYFARLAKQNGSWLIPNLSNMEWIIRQANSLKSIRNLDTLKYVHPLMQTKWLQANSYNKRATPELIEYFEKQKKFHKMLVKAFKEEGVPIVAGTDAGVSGIVWGFSLHDELIWLVDAGLTSEEALTSATRLAANWLAIGDKVGTIEEGKFADMILLDKNPLEGIENIKKISGVFFDGHWIAKKELDLLLLDLAKKNSNNLGKDKFNWNKLRQSK